MSGRSRREWIRTQRRRYRRATRQQKRQMLDEGCQMFGVHRKSLIRALGRSAQKAPKRRGRKRLYGPDLLGPLKAIWLAAARRKGLSATRSGRRLEGRIPIRTHFREVDGPGTFEADTVAHCGDSLAGAFVWTLTLTDIWSGWTENRAVWNKSSKQIVTRLRDIEQRLAFDIEGFDTDNGSEFINWHLWRYFHNRAGHVHVTRSRPYRKNDQAHVEQKQWTHVRQLLGYDRLDDRRLVARIDDLYRNEWRALQNFFLPTMQLLSRTREGGRIRRRHSKPATPYQRLMASTKVCEQAKEQLRLEFEALDPFELHDQIEAKLRAIFRLARSRRKRATTTTQKGAA